MISGYGESRSRRASYHHMSSGFPGATSAGLVTKRRPSDVRNSTERNAQAQCDWEGASREARPDSGDETVGVGALAISAVARTSPSGASVRPAALLGAVVLWSADVPPPTSPEGRGRLLRRARGRVHTRNARSVGDLAVDSRSTSALGVCCQPPPLDSRVMVATAEPSSGTKNRVTENCPNDSASLLEQAPGAPAWPLRRRLWRRGSRRARSRRGVRRSRPASRTATAKSRGPCRRITGGWAGAPVSSLSRLVGMVPSLLGGRRRRRRSGRTGEVAFKIAGVS
jgi:hypothetical protein